MARTADTLKAGALNEAKQAWEEQSLKPALERSTRAAREAGGESAVTRPAPIYTPLDDNGRDYLSDVGFPGEYPYTRGIYPSMYHGRLWTMRQYAGFGSAAETHERFSYLLGQGQGGLLVAFDLPTQLGLDSDDPRARGEVGVVGVAVDSLEDMETIFRGLPLEKASPSLTMNGAVAGRHCVGRVYDSRRLASRVFMRCNAELRCPGLVSRIWESALLTIANDGKLLIWPRDQDEGRPE